MDLSFLTNPDALIALTTLTVMEIVLGIDNIVFISILAGKLPPEQQNKARQLGLALALITRILLLLSLSWIMSLKADVFTMLGQGISGRDIILITGGLFLIYKATKEIHEKIGEHEHHEDSGPSKVVTFGNVLIQIMILDIVFSLDSVITAVGMTNHIEVMVIAVIIAVIVMMLLVNKISDFVDKNPTVKMLALSFLFMIGMVLVAEGTDVHVPKGYIYFAMAFSVIVEILNLKMKSKSRKPAV